MDSSTTRSSDRGGAPAGPDTAPAAHLVTIELVVGDGSGFGAGGALVGHLKCDGPPAFVPNMPGARYILAIDVIQATLNHRCPPGQGDDDPAGWVGP